MEIRIMPVYCTFKIPPQENRIYVSTVFYVSKIFKV